MIRRGFLALLALLSVCGQARADLQTFGVPRLLTSPIISGTITGTYTLGGTPTLGGALTINSTAQASSGLYPVYASTINPGSLTTNSAGTGYAPGDTVVLAIAGATQTTAASVGIATTKVVSATVAAAGNTCTNGTQTVTGSTGAGTKFQASVSVVGNAISAVNSISLPGDYTTNPTVLIAEPVTGASCVGSQLSVMMGILTAQPQGPNVGLFSAIPGPTATATQASTTGLGIGAVFGVSFTAPYTFFNGESGTVSPVVYGPFAAQNLTSGNEISAFGYRACNGVTTGNENTCLGWQAGGSANGSFNVFVGGAGVVLNGTPLHNVIVGDTALRNGLSINASTIVGDGAVFDYSGSQVGSITAVGRSAMQHFNDANPDTANDVALGNAACGGAASGSHAFLNDTCLGANTGGAFTTASKVLLIGQGTGNTTLASGTDVILIDSGNQTLDAPAAASSHFLNVAKVIAGDTAGATNPAVCVVGMDCVIGVLRSANFNSTADQSITIRPLTTTDTGFVSSATKYVIKEIDVTNCSVSLTTAQGGFYTAASKGGTIIGAVTTAYTGCTAATTRQKLSALTNMDNNTFSAATLILSLTTAQGVAATGDVYIIGQLLN